MDSASFLIIEHAPDYETGDMILLNRTNMVFGRESLYWKPDVSLNNVFVSRKHFLIYIESNHFYIKDLDSKHGTYINGVKLQANTPKKLATNDKISFANGLVAMSFSLKVIEETSELLPLQLEELNRRLYQPQLDSLTQHLIYQNKYYALTDKEFKLMELLLKNQFVAKDELMNHVWSERFSSDNLNPNVSSEEVHALLYRIRKKVPNPLTIETIRGKGYSLKID